MLVGGAVGEGDIVVGEGVGIVVRDDVSIAVGRAVGPRVGPREDGSAEGRCVGPLGSPRDTTRFL